jgi:hypothetical protein
MWRTRSVAGLVRARLLQQRAPIDHVLRHAARALSSKKDGNGNGGSESKLDNAQQQVGLNPRPGGLPEWIELWSVQQFHRVGILLGGVSAASVPLAMGGHIAEATPVLLCGLTAGYWMIGLRDIATKSHTLRRNFPVLIHFRCAASGFEAPRFCPENRDFRFPHEARGHSPKHPST